MLCQLCQSEPAQNFHHFLPRTLHGNKWFKKRFTRQQMARGIHVCKQCHKAIHHFIPDKKELGRRYSNLEKLLAHPDLAKYVRWRRSRRPGGRHGAG
jgi:5-methylcytosine-specific restriction endonuclease McrA